MSILSSFLAFFVRTGGVRFYCLFRGLDAALCFLCLKRRALKTERAQVGRLFSANYFFAFFINGGDVGVMSGRKRMTRADPVFFFRIGRRCSFYGQCERTMR